MIMIVGMKDNKNQFDHHKLCKMVTKEEIQQEERWLMKVSNSVAIMTRWYCMD